MKLVINKCYGGFSLSHEAVMAYAKRKGFELFAYTNARENGHISFDRYVPYNGNGKPFLVHYAKTPLGPDGKPESDSYFSGRDIPRDDPDLVAVVKKLGAKANGDHAKLGIVEVPDGVEWEIDEYDGIESIDEKHRSWG